MEVKTVDLTQMYHKCDIIADTDLQISQQEIKEKKNVWLQYVNRIFPKIQTNWRQMKKMNQVEKWKDKMRITKMEFKE